MMAARTMSLWRAAITVAASVPLASIAHARGKPEPFVRPSPELEAASNASDVARTIALGEKEVAACEARSGGAALRCADVTSYLLDAMIYQDRNKEVRDKALAYHRIITKQAPENKQVLATYANFLATVFGNLRQMEEALHYHHQEIALETQRAGNSRDLVIAYNNLGTTLDHEFQRFSEGEVYYRQALKVAEAIVPQDDWAIGLALGNLARCLDNQGRLLESLATYRLALAARQRASKEGNSSVAFAVAQGNVAMVLVQLGQYEEAETLLRSTYAINLAKKGEMSPDVHNNMLTLSNLFIRTHRFDEARSMLDKVDVLAKRAMLMQTTFQRARIASAKGLSVEARQLFEQSAAIAATDHPRSSLFAARALIGLAKELLNGDSAAQQAALALAHAEKALQILGERENPNEPFKAQAYSLIAEAALRLNDRPRAEAGYRQAEKIYALNFAGGHPELLLVRMALANLLPPEEARLRLGELAEQARTTLADYATQARLDALQDTDLTAIFAAQMDVLRKLAAHARRGSSEWRQLANEAFVAGQSLTLAGSARMLQRARAMHGADDPTLAALVREQTILSQRVAQIDQDIARTTDAARSAELAARMSEGRRAYDRATERLARDYPAYMAATRLPPPLSLGEAEAIQSPDGALMLIADAGRGGYELFLVRASGTQWVSIDAATAARLNMLSGELRDAMVDQLWRKGQPGQRGQLVSRLERRQANSIADELGRTLLSNIAGNLREVRRMDVVASGPLASAPLATMRLNGRWLGDSLNMTRFPALPQAAARPSDVTGGRALRVVGIGDGRLPEERASPAGEGRPAWASLPSLPFARAQIEELARLDAVQATTMDGEAAGEAAVKASRAIAEADIVVFATHSYVDERGRLGLVLGKGRPDLSGVSEDGFLTLEEIAQLPLKSRLVILSACDTAQQAPGDPDPMGSFARAFFAAGARSVAVSHWPIEDRSAQLLMSEFARRIAARPDHPYAEHLAEAVAHMRRSGDRRFRNPANWGAFSLIAR